MWTTGVWVTGEFVGRAALVERKADATFVALARTALPEAIEYIERLEQALNSPYEVRVRRAEARIAELERLEREAQTLRTLLGEIERDTMLAQHVRARARAALGKDGGQ